MTDGSDDPARTRTFRTPVGTVIGRVDGDVVRVLGIPYAHAARFEPPVASPPFDEPYAAFHRAPASPQLSSPVIEQLFGGQDTTMSVSEDCLALSLTLPADARPDERLPVMVWIHGGSYVNGAGDLAMYDPAALVAEQRVIVVAVTYRLGMFGFFGDGRDGSSGIPANLGLLDQIAALRWVHDTIAAFGGDPTAVTLFGQSAGGDAIAHLMISAGTEGLFQRAIIQSAPLGIARGRSAMVRAMVQAVGVPDRDAPVADVLAFQAVAERAARRFGLRGGMAFGTQYGHAPLPPESERDAAWRAVAPDIDIMIGSTAEETGLYIPLVPALDRLARLPWIGQYVRRALVAPTTNLVYTRDARTFAARHRSAGGRAIRYELTWAPEGSDVGAAHVTDVPLLLGTEQSWARAALVGTASWADIHRRGRRLRQMWADFVRSGRLAPDADAGSRDIIVLERGDAERLERAQ